MIKVAIVYSSTHHGNTRKLVEGIANKFEITIIDANCCQRADLSAYDCIGFASGIDFGRFYDSVISFLKKNLPENKRIFFLYTCAKTSRRFTETICKEAVKKDSIILGEYGCKGYNTYGPWKYLGGMNRNHPNTQDVEGAILFLESIVK